jgi:hypothetical protein
VEPTVCRYYYLGNVLDKYVVVKELLQEFVLEDPVFISLVNMPPQL